MNIPTGHTLETLTECKAGRVYLAGRIVPIERRTWQEAIDYALGFAEAPEIAQTCNPPHPECYAYMFDDGSILAVSNGECEVWAQESDYLEANDLERIDDPEHGWMYVQAVAV